MFNALVVGSSLISFAVIVCWAPDWRVLWALFPLAVVCTGITHATNQRTRRGGPRPLTDEED